LTRLLSSFGFWLLVAWLGLALFAWATWHGQQQRLDRAEAEIARLHGAFLPPTTRCTPRTER
jgi:hypothetical protein